jgi:hypothetical protein
LLVQAKKQVTEGGKQEEDDENPVTHVRQFENNACLFSCVNM